MVVRSEGGVIALAITPRTCFETRFSAQKQPKISSEGRSISSLRTFFVHWRQS